MTPEQQAALRSQLQQTLGNERFVKFVDDSNVGRLRWWEEKAWESFVATYPAQNCSPGALALALRICSLHGTPLLQDEVPLIHGCADWTEPYGVARRSTFPYANSGPAYTQGTLTNDATKSIWYCSACRATEETWLKRNGRTIIPLDWLMYRVDTGQMVGAGLRIHTELGFVGDAQPEVHRPPSEHWLEKQRKFLSKVQVGDEIWAFKSPPETWASFCGRAGFTIVRAGICIATLPIVRN